MNIDRGGIGGPPRGSFDFLAGLIWALGRSVILIGIAVGAVFGFHLADHNDSRSIAGAIMFVGSLIAAVLLACFGRPAE